VPEITYPEDLPVSQRRGEIADAIRDHQVVIVAGETGSGKTTQIPKICLELGRGIAGMIGHTQPRRIAARTVAERIADELHVELGGAVGYAVRFNDQVGDDTLIKLMTDGILLAELPKDRLLRRYDTIIVDEAHERSLNIDFILGYLKQLLPRRPDLKVIVTSATIDTERFSEHFDHAPVVEVSGRTYPVEIRYEPVADEADERDRDQTEAICDAVSEIVAQGPGDVLVFLSGEREIRDTADAIGRIQLPDTEILPLYARLSAADQHRVFRPHKGRRVVLATNVAETSITVPGIRAVVDPGTARISRYNARTKVQRLPIEAISQASANQRAGRCGRVGPGICIRLYTEEDYEGRPAFTDPEIVRTNLASVILQMASLGLGEIADFPFIDPPDRRQIAAGLALLDELGALEPGTETPRLTAIGRRLARLPIDPRLGRMLLEAERNGCVREVLIITAGLSIQDPRESPVDKREAAAEHHRRFVDPESDFVAFLNLWEYIGEQQRELSSSQFRRLCKREFLNFQRIREWQDLVTQLRQVNRSLGIHANRKPADRAALHRSLLAGLLSHIGFRDDEKKQEAKGKDRRRVVAERPSRDYQGARNTRFAIGRGSALANKAPRWVMAAELVETNRLWARTAARIEPQWAEELGAHLVQRSYSEPAWDARRAGTVAIERVTLFGVPIVTSRRVDYGRFDPELARDLFIRHALVEGDWDNKHPFVADNQRALEAVRALEDRVRRRDLAADDDALFDLYDQRVPASVISGRHFDRWYRRARADDPDGLRFTPAMLVAPGAGKIRFDDYPDTWPHGRLQLRLSYVYDRLADDDGVTVHVPLTVLNQVGGYGWDWQIPGLRPELVTALIRSLPKDVRRLFLPAAEYARDFLVAAGPDDGPLLSVLAGWLARQAGVPLTAAVWDLNAIPGYLRLTFEVDDIRMRPLASSKDLHALKRRLHDPARRAVAAATGSVERSGLEGWDLGHLPRTVEETVAGQVVRGYPGLVDEGTSVAVRVFADEVDRDRAMWAGTRRLLALNVRPAVARAARRLPNDAKLGLAHIPHADLAGFLADAADAAIDQLLADLGGPVWDGPSWDALLTVVAEAADETAERVVRRAALVLSWANVIRRRIEPMTASVLGPSVADVRNQLQRLVFPGFVTVIGGRRLIDVVRYLKATERRLDKLADDPLRDRELLRPIARLERQLDVLAAAVSRRLHPGGPAGPARPGAEWTGVAEVDDVRWMLEELRVSTWAQTLGTPRPVSVARIERALARIEP
jgi:ATP-dependent helicase HrpA